MTELIDKIKELKITHQPINNWEGTSYKPRVNKLINLDDVLKLIEEYGTR